MNKKKIFRISLLILISIMIFLLVYTPYYNHSFPRHIDEWRHINEATRLGTGEYTIGISGVELVFHFFLFLLSKIVNLVLFYKFLPALWAVLSALVLFYVSFKKTNNFYMGIFAMLFFAFLKSNVNILGLWFFTPLTFAIPFVFLYLFFFTEGLEKQNKKYILISLTIMLLILFIHGLSVLFAIPFLLIYGLMHHKYIQKEWKFFSLFLLIPLTGLIFYSITTKTSLIHTASSIFELLKFEKGWGVVEVNNSFLELHSWITYLLAIFGAFAIMIFQKNKKKYFAFILLPLTLLIMIFIFRITGVSYLSPYQRNFYYLGLHIIVLAAFGLYYLLALAKIKIKKIIKDENKRRRIMTIITILAIILIIFLMNKNYTILPNQFELYNVINQSDYNAMLFLKNQEQGMVLAPLMQSSAIYPVSRQEPLATLFFYGTQDTVNQFFYSNCSGGENITKENNISYILSDYKIQCGWNEIYNKGTYIYDLKS